MAREREREREPDGFVDAKPSRDRSIQRVGIWIEQAERELGQARSHLTTGRVPVGDKCVTFEDRFVMDREIVKTTKGLAPEEWAKASPHERVQILSELERRLATSQGREAARVYGSIGPKAEEKLGSTIPVTAERSHQTGRMQGTYVYISQPLLLDRLAARSDVRTVCKVAFEEFRHVYQVSVMTHPNRHSEVDALVREKWQHARENYDHRSREPGKYSGNALELDAEEYAERMLKEVYG